MIFHPSSFLFLAAAAAPFLKGRLKALALIGGPVLALVAMTGLGIPPRAHFMGLSLDLWRADALGMVFALVFGIVALIGHLYALHNEKRQEHVASLVMAGAGIGVVLAGDWLTLFIFWELMSVASLFLIWLGTGKNSGPAGIRYILVHVFGGGMLLAGILLHIGQGGSPQVGPLLVPGQEQGLAFWLILLAVLMNAAVPPLNAWITDAYPECSVTGSVFQSAFTTKSAVYVLLRVFPGTDILIVLGVAMALYGVVYAVLENDVRRLLAYHIVSQVGYMVAAAGIGSTLAINGAAAHAFCHVLYKSLLFMGAGAAIHATGKNKLTELGGIAKAMPWVTGLYMIGAFSISGAPLLNGFISKSMIISSAGHSGMPIAETLLVLASVGTFLHTGLKLPYFTFFGKRRPGVTVGKVPINMVLAMACGAALCAFTGMVPGWLYGRLPYTVDYHPYNFHHVLGAIEILAGTALAFWFLIKKLGGQPTITLDTDWVYRKPLPIVIGGLSRFLGRVDAWFQAGTQDLLTSAVAAAGRSGGKGVPSPIGRTLFWTAAFFALACFYAWG